MIFLLSWLTLAFQICEHVSIMASKDAMKCVRSCVGKINEIHGGEMNR